MFLDILSWKCIKNCNFFLTMKFFPLIFVHLIIFVAAEIPMALNHVKAVNN
jgi:hypothetical protein